MYTNSERGGRVFVVSWLQLASRLSLAVGFLFTVAFLAAQPAQAQSYTILYSFQCEPNDGAYPLGIVRDGTGNLYGISAEGGNQGYGTIFELSATGAESVLHSFAGSPKDGQAPVGGLIRDGAGNLYGATVAGGAFGYGSVFKLAVTGQETLMHSFLGTRADGQSPAGGVVRDTGGNFYGLSGGGVFKKGVVYKITPNRNESVLYNFGANYADGQYPSASLVSDTAGNLYGVTSQGGVHSAGTVFELSAVGMETVLHSFSGVPGDGANPAGGLIRDQAGNLSGSTFDGGSGGCTIGSGSGCGVVFRLNAKGKEAVLYNFTEVPDGAGPLGALVRDSAGNMYGTTYYGGTGSCDDGNGIGCGVIFKVTSTGQESVLYNFTGTPDGAYPQAPVVRDSEGNLYGTTYYGGAYGCGTVFKYTP